MKKKIGITAAVILGILAVCYIGFAVFFQSHFCFGTTIDGIKVEDAAPQRWSSS